MREYGKICDHPVSYHAACYFHVRARDEDVLEAQRVLYDLASRRHVEYHVTQTGTGTVNVVFGYLEGHRPTLVEIQSVLENLIWKYTPEL